MSEAGELRTAEAPSTTHTNLTSSAALLLRRLAARPTTLGAMRLLTIDGPAGSGKTTLADAVASRAGAEVPVVHTDDLIAGWDGLATAPQVLGSTVLLPLAQGKKGGYRRYDWTSARYAEWVEVDPAPLVVVEGVGSWSPAYADLVTVSAWLEVPDDLRLARGIARDGEDLRPDWLAWMRSERAWHAGLGTRARADVVLDGH